MKKIFNGRLYLLLIFLFAVSVSGAVSQGYYAAKAHASGTSLTGYAWSDNIGWISFSGSSPAYGVSEDSSGNLTGYAWSDNIGWIQFGGLSGFPSGTGTSNENAVIDSSGTLHGWARACAGTAAGDCSSMTSRTDGWDGWISLDGSTYNVNFASGNGQYSQSAYTWGSDVVGWLSFNPSGLATPPCNSAQEVCGGISPSGLTPTVNLSVSPSSVTTGTAATLTWSTSNITTCTESSSGINTDSNWSGSLSSATSSGSKSTSSFGSAGTETYNLTCTATAQAGGGQIAASPAILTVTAPAPQGGMCTSIPANATLCGGAPNPSSNTGSTLGSCSGTVSACEYTCASGYHQVGNQCIGNGSIQEQ